MREDLGSMHNERMQLKVHSGRFAEAATGAQSSMFSTRTLRGKQGTVLMPLTPPLIFSTTLFSVIFSLPLINDLVPRLIWR